MDTHAITFPGKGRAANARSFLFLQGPISNFSAQLGRALIARGHCVHRVNLHLGDRLFWPLPATDYRGRFEDWRSFVGSVLEEHKVTDLVLHGDRRPYHVVAAEEARARGITVLSTDLGYVRPDWVTVEYDGMTSFSRFPRDPAAIRSLAERFPLPDLEPRFHTPFRLVAGLDVIYNLGLVFGRPFYPHYRYHGIFHPFAEYAAWIASRAKLLFTRRRIEAEKLALRKARGSYFLFPLQLATDFQIRAHSPFVDALDALRDVIASFAASGGERKLVCIVHPLDPGLTPWWRAAAKFARDFGIADRVRVLQGGTPNELLCNAAGVVTVNSTIGIAALQNGVPVKVLGNAVFDVPGLTCQASLDDFWHDPPRPDPELAAALVRALCGATQIKGGYYEPASQAKAISGFVKRLERRPYPLPPLSADDLATRAARPPGKHVVMLGVSDDTSLALARAYAAPGTKLSLIGADPERLAAAAEDCRRRGAVVEAFRVAEWSEKDGSDRLADFGGLSASDVLVVNSAPELDKAELSVVMGIVAALSTPLYERGGGHILLVSGLITNAFRADLPTLVARRRTWLNCAESMRFRAKGRGVSVSAIVPGELALRAAAYYGQPSLAVVNPDRAALAILRGAQRRRAVIEIPCSRAIAARMLCLAPSMLRDRMRHRLMPAMEPVADSAERMPLGTGTGSSD